MPWALFGEEHKLALKEMSEARSDRIIAILGGAILDSTLRRTVSERLKNDEDIANKLFRVNGALGNMEPKVDLLYLLNGLERPVRNALYGLITIRNFFAHRLDASFNSTHPTMIDARKKLTLHEGRKYYPHHLYNQDSEHEIEPVKSDAALFVVNLKLCLIALMRDRVSHESWSWVQVSEDELRKRRGEKKA